MSKDEKSSPVVQILVAVAIALIAGGTAPWWWAEVKELFIPAGQSEGNGQEVLEEQPQLQESESPVTKTVTVCSHLKVTASWDGTTAREESNTCTYTPPQGWRIIDYRTEEHSNNNGSVAVSFDPQSLSAEVRAKAHGSVFDRKRGWVDVTIFATLEEAK